MRKTNTSCFLARHKVLFSQNKFEISQARGRKYGGSLNLQRSMPQEVAAELLQNH